MLERTQVFVDTSYLLASFYNSWETGARAQLEIDLPEVVSVLGSMIEAQLGQPIQRQMWYDGIPDSGPHRYQRALRTCDGVQLRAGQLIEWGERRTQKAVDTRLVADMVLAGVRGLCSDIVLVSGDADMIPGVQEATLAGVRVHLYGFGWDSMSSALRHSCDSTTILDPREDFADCMQLQVLEGPIPPVFRPKPIGDAEPIEEIGSTTVPEPAAGKPNGHPELQHPTTDEDGEPTVCPAKASYGGQTAADAGTAESAVTEILATPETTLPTQIASSTEQEIAFEQDPSLLTPPSDSARSESESVIQHTDSKISEQPHATVENTGETDAAAQTATYEASPATESSSNGPDSARLTYSREVSVETVETIEVSTTAPATTPETNAGVDQGASNTPASEEDQQQSSDRATPAKRVPNPSMMAPKRRLNSRYVPISNEVWESGGFQTPFDVGQQYAAWWFDNAATDEQRNQAHMLSGGPLPSEVDKPLLQFACERLHEYTLTETQRVDLRDGFHQGIRGVLLNLSGR